MKRSAAVRYSLILATGCILLSGCADKKRIAELELEKQSLEQRAAKLEQDYNYASNALKQKQAEIDRLQAQFQEYQAKIAEQKLVKKDDTKTGTKQATTSASSSKKGATPAKSTGTKNTTSGKGTTSKKSSTTKKK